MKVTATEKEMITDFLTELANRTDLDFDYEIKNGQVIVEHTHTDLTGALEWEDELEEEFGESPVDEIRSSDMWLNRYGKALEIREEFEKLGADIDSDESGVAFEDTYIVDVEDLLSHFYSEEHQ